MLILPSVWAEGLAETAQRLPQEELNAPDALDRLRAEAQLSEPLQRLAALARGVLDEQGFVQIRGFPSEPASSLFPALGSLIGTLFVDPGIGTAIINAHVRPCEKLMGNQLRSLPMHTDYSMFAEPPRFTMSCCVTPDPIPDWGALMVADVEAICFGVERDPQIEAFHTVSLPFAAGNAQSGVDLFESPIISRDATGELLVRYHRTRIVHGFRAKAASATSRQAATMLAFERFVKASAETLHPLGGDVTIINNRRTVHSRSRCSVEIDVAGTTRGRQMQFIFAY